MSTYGRKYAGYQRHEGIDDGRSEEGVYDKTPLTANNGDRSGKKAEKRRSGVVFGTIGLSLLALVLCVKALLSASFKNDSDHELNGPGTRARKKLFDEHGRYIVEDFDALPTFSDFLPGVAGIYGKPVWSFYVNRGQGIASFGTRSKDYPILEFNAANKAYQNTALLGFRTFLHGTRGGRSFLSEPFTPIKTRFSGIADEISMLPKRWMYVGTNEMRIRETDLANKVETNVTYFTLPEEDFGAFVRRTTITNLDKEMPLEISLLDGLARMEPAGGELDDLLKTMGRTLEGWFGVYRVHKDTPTMPFYRMSTEVADTASVKIQEAGHYCLSFLEGTFQLLPIVFDSSKVFGEDTMMLRPIGLQTKSIGDIIAGDQYGFAKTSSAFAAVDKVTIEPGGSLTVASFYGKAEHALDVPVIARRIMAEGFVQYKHSRARELINQITSGVETKTANVLFNGHIQQMYMDNSLRGGIPFILGDVDDEAKMRNADEDNRLKVYHLFSRIHGDLERDYNDFDIDPTFFSQGPGNFRDVAQNRRNDVIFNPRIGAFNVKMFLSYIQADGYNPLSIEGIVFSIREKEMCQKLAAKAVGYAEGHRAQREVLAKFLNSGPFRPGQLFLFLEQQHIELVMTNNDFMDCVAAAASVHPMGVFGKGYWADHWTYYMDLISSYRQIYPDGEENLMYDTQLPYFFSPATVRPRRKKYVLSLAFQGKGKHVRQLDATVKDKNKKKLMKGYFSNTTGWYKVSAHWQHESKGNIFLSSPIAKLLLLATIKFASRDAYGMGVEYEGGKPGWNDAMNGLVGMVGSGMPETYELEVLLRYLRKVNDKYRRTVTVPDELASLVDAISSALDALDSSQYVDATKLNANVPFDLFEYWDCVATAREEYRKKIDIKFSGDVREMSPDTIESILDRWLEQVSLGKSRAVRIGSHGDGDHGKSGITPTYFSYNVTQWALTGKNNIDGHPLVTPKEMSVGKFPLFLEGPVRMMKTVNQKGAIDIYNKVKKSALRDDELNMYTISASLVGQSYDMGRMMSFSPGWLENQSVWVHMSYKYYLELLRQGLYKEFYDEMQSGGMLPFMKPGVYGRSLMECSSFIASSAFDDPTMRGRGFLARLSGSTAEFLSMWVLMMIGPEPFFLDPKTNELRMQLVPALPLWLFQSDFTEGDGENDKDSQTPTLSFKLFSSITVNYRNTEMKDLFGVSPKKYKVGLRDGSQIPIDGPTIPNKMALKIRQVVLVDYIDAYF